MDFEMQEQITAFRYGLIAPVISRRSPMLPGELKHLLEEIASHTYTIPGSSRTTVSTRTLSKLQKSRLGGAKTKAASRDQQNKHPPFGSAGGNRPSQRASGAQCGADYLFIRARKRYCTGICRPKHPLASPEKSGCKQTGTTAECHAAKRAPAF